MYKKTDAKRSDAVIVIRCRKVDKIKWHAKAKTLNTTLSKVVIKRLKRL